MFPLCAPAVCVGGSEARRSGCGRCGEHTVRRARHNGSLACVALSARFCLVLVRMPLAYANGLSSSLHPPRAITCPHCRTSRVRDPRSAQACANIRSKNALRLPCVTPSFHLSIHLQFISSSAHIPSARMRDGSPQHPSPSPPYTYTDTSYSSARIQMAACFRSEPPSCTPYAFPSAGHGPAARPVSLNFVHCVRRAS